VSKVTKVHIVPIGILVTLVSMSIMVTLVTKVLIILRGSPCEVSLIPVRY